MSEARLRLTVTIITIVLAFALLFGAIYHLYSIAPNNNKLKLALIAVYTILFAASVGLVTNASRGEIFGACAAYAAVLVVFVSGQLGGN
jgi:FtsH-binding integral membrane protein